MIITKRKDIGWNLFGSLLNYSFSLIILPIVLSSLSPQELGIWYVFVSISAFVMLMDFGFSPTIMRNIAYAWSGAKEILPEGTSKHEKVDDKPNLFLLKCVEITSRRIYTAISILAGFVLLSGGVLYVKSLANGNLNTFLIAWVIYSISIVIDMNFSYLNPMLRGTGNIGSANRAIIISKVLYVLVAAIGLLLGGGLIWLSLSQVTSSILFRLLARNFLSHNMSKNYQSIIVNRHDIKTTFHAIWPNARKQGIVTVGSWLITRGNTIVCSTFLGLEVTAQYGLSLQLLSIVNTLAQLVFNTYSPEIASLKIGGSGTRYSNVMSRVMAIQWIISIFGIVSVIIFGPFALKLIGSNSELLPRSVLITFGVILFLEWNHSSFATIITLSNRVPFVKSSLISGVSILILSLLSIKLTHLGILGLILSQGLVQLMYNNWYWPKRVLIEDNISILSILNNFWNQLIGIPFLCKFRRK